MILDETKTFITAKFSGSVDQSHGINCTHNCEDNFLIFLSKYPRQIGVFTAETFRPPTQ